MVSKLGCPSAVAALAAMIGIAGCAGSGESPSVDVSAGLYCIDDSKECIGRRSASLKALQADKSRAWVRQRPDALSYASGVRLFAFRTLRADLTCEELGIGRREADGAAGALRGPSGKGLSPAQVSRGVMLGGEVSRDLAKEMSRRCRT